MPRAWSHHSSWGLRGGPSQKSCCQSRGSKCAPGRPCPRQTHRSPRAPGAGSREPGRPPRGARTFRHAASQKARRVPQTERGRVEEEDAPKSNNPEHSSVLIIGDLVGSRKGRGYHSATYSVQVPGVQVPGLSTGVFPDSPGPPSPCPPPRPGGRGWAWRSRRGGDPWARPPQRPCTVREDAGA